MEKLLNSYNEKKFAENTVCGARQVLDHFLKDLPDRHAHSLRVYQNVGMFMDTITMHPDKKKSILLAALLHDIGYSPDLRSSGFHPFDGYIYLHENGWDFEVTSLVLGHSFARELSATQSPELYHIYYQKEKFLDTELLTILSLADFTAGPTGNLVTLSDRVNDIVNRYGEESPISKHALLAKRSLRNINITSELLTRFNLSY